MIEDLLEAKRIIRMCEEKEKRAVSNAIREEQMRIAEKAYKKVKHSRKARQRLNDIPHTGDLSYVHYAVEREFEKFANDLAMLALYGGEI